MVRFRSGGLPPTDTSASSRPPAVTPILRLVSIVPLIAESLPIQTLGSDRFSSMLSLGHTSRPASPSAKARGDRPPLIAREQDEHCRVPGLHGHRNLLVGGQLISLLVVT